MTNSNQEGKIRRKRLNESSQDGPFFQAKNVCGWHVLQGVVVGESVLKAKGGGIGLSTAAKRMTDASRDM